MREASVRFYVDADTLGLARILTQVRADVTYPGDPGGVLHGRRRPPCPITSTATDDVDWIPVVAQRGWIVITRDKRIARRPAERAAVLDAGAKVVAITTSQQLNNWGMLEVVMCQWRHIESLSREPGPWIESITRTSHRQLLP